MSTANAGHNLEQRLKAAEAARDEAKARAAAHQCPKPSARPVGYHETLIQTLTDWANLGAEVSELALSRPHFLAVAAAFNVCVPDAPASLLYPRLPLIFRTTDVVDQAPNPRALEIRVGDSFVVYGPAGPVTIRNADAEPVVTMPRKAKAHALEDMEAGIGRWPRPDTSVAHLDVDLLADDA